ncbi:MAG: ImmA/IrrE family metallo-endopeptidase [Bradymonadia bacterium]
MTDQSPRWLNLRGRDITPQDLLTGCGVMHPPVPIFELARWLDVRVDFSANHADGHMVLSSSALIVLNSRKPAVRQRFTLAHLVAHMLLHTDVVELVEDFNTRDMGPVAQRRQPHLWEREREADDFAAELLVPSKMLDLDLLEEKWRDPDLLAQRYQVSPTTMQVRLKELLKPGP